MATISKVTELDFNTIKTNLKNYFNRSGSPFRDWDFEGSGLSYLLDILAYNTHYNAVNAHLAMNESFLDSAQIRSNVVSRAKLIGYTPRSRRGARATVNLSFTRDDAATEVLTLPRGTTFKTTIDGSSYTFSTREDYTSVYDTATALFTFNDVTIVQGSLEGRSYIIDSTVAHQKFTIDDANIDTSTLEIKVRDHSSTTNTTTYLNGDLFSSFDSTTKAYFLSERHDGLYQIEFGNGIIGQKLENLNIVEATFLSSAGEIPNGASIFSFVSANNTTFSNAASLSTLTTVDSSFGGDERETSESIRQLAPITYISQNRAVTVNDYEALIKQNIPDIEAVSVWGGQDNDPPVYGYIYIAGKPKDEFFLTQAQKDEIVTYLNRIKILTVKPVVVDPSYIYLYFDVFFKFDPNLTTQTRTQLESAVRTAITNYNDNELSGFDKVFRYSNILSVIDDTDPAILNSFARIYAYKNFNLYAGRTLPQELDFNLELYGEINQSESVLSSSSWRYNNQDVFLGDDPISGATEERLVYVYSLDSKGNEVKVFNDIGRVNIKTGKLSLEAVETTFDTQIKVRIIPDSYDVATVRSQLVNIDLTDTVITGDIDDTFNTGAADRTYDTVSRFRN